MTTFSTFATATYADGNVVVVQSAENMIPGLPITFAGNTFGNVTANATYYIGNITFGFPTSNITITSLPGGAIYPVGNGSGSMVASFSQGGQQIIPTVPPGEPLNQAFDAINLNFDQVWAAGPVGTNIQIDENTIYTLNTNGNLVLNPNGIGNVVANAHVVPDRDRVRNLGAPLLRWNTVYAQNFVGNGGGISNITVSNISNGSTNVTALANANVTVTVAGTANVAVFTANGLLINGTVSSSGNVTAPTFIGNLVGNITGNIDAGGANTQVQFNDNDLLAGSPGFTFDKTSNAVAVIGTVTAGNILTAGIVSAASGIYGDIYTTLIESGDSSAILILSDVEMLGDLGVAQSLEVGGTISATGNIAANYYFGNGSQLTGITADNVNADDLVGNILSGNVLYSNLITVGNLLSLSVIGNTTTGNLDTTGAISATGNVTGNYILGNGALLTGVITSVANINNGNSNVTIGNPGGNVTFGVSGNDNVMVVSSTDVTINGNLTVTGNATLSGNILGDRIQNGNTQIDIQTAGGNANVSVGGISNVAVFATTGMFIDGIVSVTGNVTANYYFGNGSQLTGITADNVNADDLIGNILSSNVLFSSLTSVGTLSNLSVAGTVTVGNITIPSSGNVTLGNVNINDLAEPYANSDAATKFYVDSVAANVLPIISNQTINPDGISNTFVLNQTATDVGILLTINGITQTPTTNYTVTGNSLTIGETPLSSDIIQVRYLSGTQIGGGGGTNYANANAVAYGESGWAGNLIPSGNLVYNLGNSTNRWNDLYLSGNTIYLDSATIGANGNDVMFSGNVTGDNLIATGNIVLTGSLIGSGASPAPSLSGFDSLSAITITATSTGTAINAASGNILTNKVTGTQFAFLNGLYTATLTGGGATSNYTLNLPANAGANGQVLTTDGSGNLIWTTAAGSYGNANVATFLANLGSNTISTTGNITAGNLVGNISITGNVTGTTANVQLVAGVNTWTFDNAGNLVLPGNTFAVNYANGTPVDPVTKFAATWTVPTGNSTQSFTVTANNTYVMWIEGNIPNGIVAWNATVSITNTNVPVLGQQQAWNYTGGGSPLLITSIPNQIIGTAGGISNASPAVSNTNTFTFGFNNTSGSAQIIRYGWTKISNV